MNELPLPEMLQMGNVTLGMLISDAGLMQYTNGSSMATLSEQLSDELFVKNLDDATAAAAAQANAAHQRDSLLVIVPVTICYLLIFVAGLLGNVITCTVISRNKPMHTATNYYLFNLAISDLMLLLSGLPVDTYNIWYPATFPVIQSVCILQGLLSETSTNATVLTITSFTVERYIAICHPFRQHTMSKLSRAIRFIMAIWIVAFCLAIPQACQFGVVTVDGGSLCTVKNVLVEHAFEVSSFVFFVGPMTLICVLYVLIGIKLRKSKLLQGVKRRGIECGSGGGGSGGGRNISGQTRVIRMLVAVAVAFFLCWAPFHAQRLMAVYGKSAKPTSEVFRNIYTILTYSSGVLYFLSTCINPLLYSIMSHKFRDAFKTTLARQFGLHIEHKKCHTYSALSKCGNGHGSLRLTGPLQPTALNQRQSNILHMAQQHSHHFAHHLHHGHQQHGQQQPPTVGVHQRDYPHLTAVTVHRAPLAPLDDDMDDVFRPCSENGTFIEHIAIHRTASNTPSTIGRRSIDSSMACPLYHQMNTNPSTNNNVPCHSDSAADCSNATVNHASHCALYTRCPHQSGAGYHRNRCISVSSQATLLTTVSRNADDLCASQSRLDQPTSNGRHNRAAKCRRPAMLTFAANGNGKTTRGRPDRERNGHKRHTGGKSALGSIAEKLRRGTRKVLQFTSGSAPSSLAASTAASADGRSAVAPEVPVLVTTCASAAASSSTTHSGEPDALCMRAVHRLQKHNSIDSARTNTISNSSLQEVDAEEFDSAELAKHMGEINNEINPMQCCGGSGAALSGGDAVAAPQASPDVDDDSDDDDDGDAEGDQLRNRTNGVVVVSTTHHYATDDSDAAVIAVGQSLVQRAPYDFGTVTNDTHATVQCVCENGLRTN